MKSGKSEVRNQLVSKWGFAGDAFANPVKDASVAALNAALVSLGLDPFMTREVLERDKSQLRALPQFIGTDFGRNYLAHPDIWINLLLDRVRGLDNVVVDDCRFLNEAESLRDAGFRIVRIERPIEERQRVIFHEIWKKDIFLSPTEVYQKMHELMSHPSEVEQAQIVADYVLENTGDLDHLYQITDSLVSSLMRESL